MSYLTHSLEPRIEYAPRPAGVREKRRRPGTVARTLLGTVREGSASKTISSATSYARSVAGWSRNPPVARMATPIATISGELGSHIDAILGGHAVVKQLREGSDRWIAVRNGGDPARPCPHDAR